MILVDTSVWVQHLRANDPRLAGLLNAACVLMHPFVLGELALGHIRHRKMVLAWLSNLPLAKTATDAEVLNFIDRQALYARGVGYVDAHLLAAVRLTLGSTLWTNDKRLNRLAEELGLAMTR